MTVPGEKTILYTATSDFITDAVAVEQIGVDYATLALNSLTPIRFTIRNTGLNDVTSLTVSLGRRGNRHPYGKNCCPMKAPPLPSGTM